MRSGNFIAKGSSFEASFGYLSTGIDIKMVDVYARWFMFMPVSALRYPENAPN